MSATALYKALIEAKVSDETAEKAVESVPIARDVATKSDIANVRADIAEGRADTAVVRTEIAEGRTDTAVVRTEVAEGRADTAEVRTEVAGVLTKIAEVRTELKTDIAKVRTEIAQLEVRMVKWQVATHGAYAGLIIAAMGLMIKFWIL